MAFAGYHYGCYPLTKNPIARLRMFKPLLIIMISLHCLLNGFRTPEARPPRQLSPGRGSSRAAPRLASINASCRLPTGGRCLLLPRKCELACDVFEGTLSGIVLQGPKRKPHPGCGYPASPTTIGCLHFGLPMKKRGSMVKLGLRSFAMPTPPRPQRFDRKNLGKLT